MGISAPVDIPATSPRAPRRSFASSFGGFSPMTPAKALPSTPSLGLSDAANRVSSQYSPESEGRSKHYTPVEVVDLARSLASPVLLPAGGLKGAELKRRKSAGASIGHRNSLSLSAVSSPEKPPAALEPVEYVQLDDETLLPYVDRPDEVRELMQHASNKRMFDMLRAAFPKTAMRGNWKDVSPGEWYWDELVAHLTQTDRRECGDYEWVLRAREAIRRRSVALWEKVGVCLGCDDRLLQAGSEEAAPATWGGLGEDDDDEYERGRSQVWIEGLAPVDPDELERAERQFREEFGDIVEDDAEAAAAGMTALLGTIGEGEGEEEGDKDRRGGGGARVSRQTTAQRAGSKDSYDPLDSLSPHRSGGLLPASVSPGKTMKNPHAHARSKSFVGLTIQSGSLPATSIPGAAHVRSPGYSPTMEMDAQMGLGMAMPTYDRDPGQALFPSGFASLSAEPNLGRAASGLVGGVKPQVVPSAFTYGYGYGDMEDEKGRRDWKGMLKRRQSGTGLSESECWFNITFCISPLSAQPALYPSIPSYLVSMSRFVFSSFTSPFTPPSPSPLNFANLTP